MKTRMTVEILLDVVSDSSDHEVENIKNILYSGLSTRHYIASVDVSITQDEVISGVCSRCGESIDEEYDEYKLDEYYGEVFCEECYALYNDTYDTMLSRHLDEVLQDTKEEFEKEGNL